MKRTHGKNKGTQFLVKPKHGLENIHQNLPKSHPKSVQQQKTYVSSNINQLSGKLTTMSFVSTSLSIVVDLFAAKIAGSTLT